MRSPQLFFPAAQFQPGDNTMPDFQPDPFTALHHVDETAEYFDVDVSGAFEMAIMGVANDTTSQSNSTKQHRPLDEAEASLSYEYERSQCGADANHFRSDAVEPRERKLSAFAHRFAGAAWNEKYFCALQTTYVSYKVL